MLYIGYRSEIASHSHELGMDLFSKMIPDLRKITAILNSITLYFDKWQRAMDFQNN
jgi:hypothetical protein